MSKYLDRKYDELQSRYSFLSEPEWWRKRNIVVFGGGNTFTACIAPVLRENEIAWNYICDSNPAKRGTTCAGVEIISPDELSAVENVFVIVSAGRPKYIGEITSLLKQKGIDFITFAELLGLVLSWRPNQEKLLTVLSMLEDEQSKFVFTQVIKARLEITTSNLFAEIYSPRQYFCLPQFFCFDANEIFIDAGSFTGEIIEEYLALRYGSNSVKKVYAFEPSLHNYTALQCRVERLKNEWGMSRDSIICVNGGVGAVTETVPFDGEEFADSRFSENAKNMIKCHALDDYLDGAPVTFLKADVEGFELKMLQGAKNTIVKYRPKIAICLYHKPQDLYEIPLLLQKYVPEYKFMVRHHRYDSWAETVLYCFVDD